MGIVNQNGEEHDGDIDRLPPAIKEQADQQVQAQQRQLRSSLSKEQYKWNNAEIYGPGGRGDEN